MRKKRFFLFVNHEMEDLLKKTFMKVLLKSSKEKYSKTYTVIKGTLPLSNIKIIETIKKKLYSNYKQNVMNVRFCE